MELGSQTNPKFVWSQMRVPAEPAFPPEILEELIDRLHSTTALLSFGLVCRRALIKIRHILFSNLEFTKNEDFEQFLELVDAPWTIFFHRISVQL